MLGQGENSTPLLLKPQELTGMQMKSFKNDSLLASTAGNKRKGENASLKMKVDAYQLCPLLDGSWGIATRRLLNSTQNRFKSRRQIFKQWLLHSLQNTAKTGRLMLTQRLLHSLQNAAKMGRQMSTQRLLHSLQNTAKTGRLMLTQRLLHTMQNTAKTAKTGRKMLLQRLLRSMQNLTEKKIAQCLEDCVEADWTESGWNPMKE